MISNQLDGGCYPFKGKTVAQVRTEEEKSNLKNYCYPPGSGMFIFAEGFTTLRSMFFYRREWLKCIVLPKSMRVVEKYSCVPYIKATEHKIIEHKKDDYRYPSEWAVHRNKLGYYVSKTQKQPIAVVVRNSKTYFDSYAFGDGIGDEQIVLFLEFKSDYDTSHIRGNVKVYKFGEWDYKNGIPSPH